MAKEEKGVKQQQQNAKKDEKGHHSTRCRLLTMVSRYC